MYVPTRVGRYYKNGDGTVRFKNITVLATKYHDIILIDGSHK